MNSIDLTRIGYLILALIGLALAAYCTIYPALQIFTLSKQAESESAAIKQQHLQIKATFEKEQDSFNQMQLACNFSTLKKDQASFIELKDGEKRYDVLRHELQAQQEKTFPALLDDTTLNEMASCNEFSRLGLFMMVLFLLLGGCLWLPKEMTS